MNRLPVVLRSLNCDGRYGLTLAGACVLLIALTATGEPGRLLLRYDRAALAHGEVWRLLTAHLVHLDLRHAFLNCAGLVLLWALFARDYHPLRWLAIALAATAAIDAGLWWWNSTLLWYVGSSGMLHGLMAAGTVAHLRRGERDRWLLTAFLVAKIAWEQAVGPLPLSGHDPVVVDAHLYGVLGGLAAAVLLRSAA